MADEEQQAHPVRGLLFIIGLGLLIGGIAWAGSVCQEECNCSPDRCCEASDSCQSETPCSCLSDANDWSVPTCEKKEENCGDMYPFALAMLISGVAVLFSPLFLLPFYCAYQIFKALHKLWFKILKRCKHPGVSEVEFGTVGSATQ